MEFFLILCGIMVSSVWFREGKMFLTRLKRKKKASTVSRNSFDLYEKKGKKASSVSKLCSADRMVYHVQEL